MDENTRGFIEKTIDEVVAGITLEDVEWIEHEMPIKSLRDLAIGLTVGIIHATSVVIASIKKRGGFEKEEKEEIRTIIKRRLPEIVKKIEKEVNR